jgi:mRNA-degrading endonuclease RelE of RelBE toxin-antitoxin system
MSYKIIPVDKFKKEAKRLARKYPSLKVELIDLEKLLIANPEAGTPLGNNTFKIRISISSKGKGKSGGGRVITYHLSANKEVYLLLIYDKSEIANVDDRTLRQIVSSIKKG